VTAAFRALIAVIVLVVVCSDAGAANRYDPRLRFRTLTTPHFTIYFHQQEDALARRLAAIAEDVADRVSAELGRPNGRVHVILVNQHDLSNGWATPVPYNTIEISAAVPPGESQIGNTDDWLRLVLAHEYTHIVHLDKVRGWIGALRYVFGHAPVLYPNLFLPLWQVEGIATYNESVLTGEGRIPAGDFRLIVDRAAASRRFNPIDRANGGLVDWPGGSAQYAYGGYFHQYLADRFGAASISKLADETSGRVPYFGAPAFRKVFHRSLGDLWTDFESEVQAHAAEETGGATRLTHHGFTVGAPTFGRDARLFYSVANPHGFPALMTLKPDQPEPREVTSLYLGRQIGARGGLLVFDQLELVHNVGLQSDLYAVGENGGRVRRITHLARASDPDLAPDGRTVVCTIQLTDRRALATLQLPSPGSYVQPSILLSEAATEYSSPRWSPDGSSIAAERRQLGGPSEIVIVDVGTGRIRAIASSRDGRNVTPSWLSSSVVLFASDRGGRPFNIYSVDLVTGAVRRLIGAGPSAQAPVVSPDGARLVFIGYTTDGYDLFSLPMATATWSDVQSTPAARNAGASSRSIDSVSTSDQSYRPWRTLVPQYWMPIVQSDAGEVLLGAATSSNDVLGRHGYGGSVAWSSSRVHPDWSFAYAYDRWWPTWFASVSDDTDPWRGGEIQTREVNAGALLAVARIRWSVNLLAAINASEDRFSCDGCDPPAPPNVRRGAVRTGWSFDNAKTYGYSISRESGGALRMTWEFAPEALGSDASNGSMTIDARGYQPFGPAHAVVAARAGSAYAWGDQNARRIFSASGSGPASSGFDFGRGSVGLLRGFESDTIIGSRVAVANLDYRFPLWRLQRGVGTIPMFIRTIHAAAFADAGTAWDDAFKWDDVRVSTGAELSFDTVLGFGFPVSFTTGIAWRYDPVGTQDGVAVFGRIGRAF
jgi:surface antigen Omp85-like protein/WD40 repeat protein